jgi:RimJ/RimL family protein N-acetyltransferase
MSNVIKDKRSGIASAVRRIFGPGLAEYIPVCIRLRRCLETPSFRLRVYGPRDLRTLQDLFGPEMLPKPFHSSLSFRRWLISTFQILYMLETRGTRGMTGVVGFIGLYSIDPGRSVWLSAGIFNPEDRGKGYGSKGLIMLFDYLQENAVAKKAYVEVMKTNERSLTFFERSGFTVRLENEDTFVLEKDL